MAGQGNDGRDPGEDFDAGPPLRQEPVEELSLPEARESLPWLESDDYEDEPANAGMGQMLGLGLGGLLVIGLLLGGLWYWSNRPDPGMVADGSTIEAPPGPVKERPENPGGKEFAGTGDVAPGVGEGQSQEGRLATQPAIQPVPGPSVDAAGSRAPEPAQAGGVGIQVGAFSSRESAERGWATLTRQTDALAGVSHRVMEGQIDSGTVYRLQAVAGDAAGARALCATLKSQGIACQVKD